MDDFPIGDLGFESNDAGEEFLVVMDSVGGVC